MLELYRIDRSLYTLTVKKISKRGAELLITKSPNNEEILKQDVSLPETPPTADDIERWNGIFVAVISKDSS
jgi:hypothetical protein